MFKNDMSMYIGLYNNKYGTIEELLEEITGNEEHQFWGACRDIAKQKLHNTCWRDASEKIDDRAFEVTQYMCNQIIVWIEKAKSGTGSLSRHLDDLATTIKWLFVRWISTFKNSFDKRYKFYIPPITHVSFDENSIYV